MKTQGSLNLRGTRAWGFATLSRLLATTTVVIVLSLAVLALAAGPASAYTQSFTGRPGTAWAYGANTGYVTPTAWDTMRLNSGRFVVYRSPGFSGTQRITVTWRVWKYMGGRWVLVASPSATYNVSPTQRLDMPGWYYAGDGGYYAMDSKVTWRTSTGAFIGQGFYDYVHASDYRCASSWPSCKIDYNVGGQATIQLAS